MKSIIKIKLIDAHLHRNECLYRPFLFYYEQFLNHGIEFVTSGNDYDLAWIGQASYVDKSLTLSQSTEKGLDFLSSIEKPFCLMDGQDSASLMGSYDVFIESKASLLIKNSLYSDLEQYKKPWINGRMYWGESDDYGWKIENDSRLKDVVLSGTNWLSTISPRWLQYDSIEKDIDVFALFAYPTRDNYEFGVKTSFFYDRHRRQCVEWLKKLPKHIRVVTLPDSGKKFSLEEYYDMMCRSKLVVAPFGYGEMAPRDVEANMVGAILIKPDMSHVSSIPLIYGNSNIVVKWDYSDLNEKIIQALSDFKVKQKTYVDTFRTEYTTQYSFRTVYNSVVDIINQIN